MKSRWITHKGARIFIADFSDYSADADAVQAEADYVVQLLQLEPPDSVLSIAHVDGTFANEKTMRTLMNLVPVTNKYVKKRCTVGVRGFRKHLLAGFTRITGRAQFTLFDTMEEALDFLAKE
ncbi:MAG: hypothetical protein PHQ36_12700 [Anaerolineales bacterium]|nr:hypothetical protein [Anaerolineales bacterium]